jgi:Flp pilus assembly pilin Flp
MSDITATTQDAMREFCIRARFALSNAVERAKEQRGQTAAEYMGILLIVSLIIGALVTAGVPGLIKDAVDNLVRDIGNGREDKAGI